MRKDIKKDFKTFLVMGEENKVGAYNFVAEPFHVDFTGKLTMGVLGNHLKPFYVGAIPSGYRDGRIPNAV